MGNNNSASSARSSDVGDEYSSFHVDRRVFDRFNQFKQEHESQIQALNRLMDEAGVPEILRCTECGGPIRGRYVGLKDKDSAYHVDCVELPLSDD